MYQYEPSLRGLIDIQVRSGDKAPEADINRNRVATAIKVDSSVGIVISL